MGSRDWLSLADTGGKDALNLSQLAELLAVSDRTFVRCDGEPDLSYVQFWNLAGKFANALKSFGARRSDRIAVQIDKSVEALVLFWACARGGFVFLPLNPAYTAREADYFIGDAEPAVFVCTPERLAEMRSLASVVTRCNITTLDDRGGGELAQIARGLDSEVSAAGLGWDDPVAVLYTSGTTGRSKGAVLTHGNLASNALTLIDCWQFTSNDVLIHALPVYHTHGLFTATNTVFLAGAQMIFQRKFDADAVLAAMPRATCMMGVPTFYTRLLAHSGLTREAVANIRVFISGSAPLLADTHRQFQERTGHAILERYGMTETSMNTSNPYQGVRKAGSVGLPLKGISVRITSLENGAVLPGDESGLIEVRGPNVFKEYWRNPEKTAEDMTVDGYFRTGDVGRIDEDGYVWITGRAKDLIITGGFNVYPKDIEELLDGLPGVVESAVIGLPHPDFGEGVTAIIAIQPGRHLTEQAVISQVQPKLAKFKLPKAVIFVDTLPRNAMGKVQKADLRRIYQGLYRPV